VNHYNKAIVAIAAGLAVAVSVTTDGNVSTNDVFAILSAAAGALAVFAVPNRQKNS
jgi:hypothetical protein